MTKKYILGNWKMYGSQAEAQKLARAIVTHKSPANTVIALFPPFPHLSTVSQSLDGSAVALGAQDCSKEADGAFTGDVSAAMLKDAGCKYVIVGHSERRLHHAEPNEMVKNKATAALAAGLKPVICVGENLAERESGKYLEIITSQVRQSLPSLSHSESFLIAYEPVWAIGTGKVADLQSIMEVHKTIASLLSYATSGARTAILYGGSVKAANAREILSCEGVDGVLVGGASLKADEFCAIIAAAQG